MKLGLYFNGKFCVYYLDRDNHLYEYHAPTIDEACNLVNDFFTQTLDLKQFEKHFFNIGNQPHFVTSDFVYRVNIIRVFIMVAGFSIYLLSVFLLAYFNTRGPVDIYFKCFFAAFIILMGCAMGYFVLNNMKSRHQYLKISRGNNLFSYGWDEQHITTYDKLNIEVINYSVGNKGAIVNVEITFKDGRSIKPKYVIDGNTLLGKFPEKLQIPKNVR